MELGVPDKIIKIFARLNRSLPKLQAVDLIDEGILRRRMDVMNLVVPLRGHPNSILLRPENATGVPQGAPTSPFFSILVLDRIMKTNANLFKVEKVGYADDGNLFSNEPLENLGVPMTNPNISNDPVIRAIHDNTMLRANINYAEEKCGYVKYDDKWLKPLKFLGLTYDGEKDELYASTRKGSELVFDEKAKKLTTAYYYREKDYPETDSKFAWHHFLESTISGFIQSRLYSGS
jgi:hypothetical protein